MAGRQNVVVELAGHLDFAGLWVSSILGFAGLPLTPSPSARNRATSGLQQVPRGGHGLMSAVGARPMEPPLAMSVFRVPAGQAGWSGALLGPGKT
jgi:hypothetical protein